MRSVLPQMNTAVLRLKKNDDLFRHIEGDKYLNIRTQKEWEIPPEKASEIFVLNVEASILLNEYPMIEKLIASLKLTIER